MENLNLLELSILEAILEENKNKYPLLLSQIPLLKVINREYTGVGLYSNFSYVEFVKEEEVINDLLSSKKKLIIEGVKNELSYVLDISKGKIKFLEIVTNGNDTLNDKIKNFTLL